VAFLISQHVSQSSVPLVIIKEFFQEDVLIIISHASIRCCLHSSSIFNHIPSGMQTSPCKSHKAQCCIFPQTIPSWNPKSTTLKGYLLLPIGNWRGNSFAPSISFTCLTFKKICNWLLVHFIWACKTNTRNFYTGFVHAKQFFFCSAVQHHLTASKQSKQAIKHIGTLHFYSKINVAGEYQ